MPDPSAAPPAETTGNGKSGKKNITAAVLAVAIIATCAYGAKWFAHRLAYTVTEDAQIDADLLPVSSKAAGRVIRFHVSEGDQVKAGQLLAEIDPADYELALERAKAGLEIASRELEKAQSALAAVESLRAKVRDMRAAVKQAEILLRETRVLSPVKGVVAKKTTAKTEFAPAGKPLCFILDTSNVWVSANIEETFLGKIAPGADATIFVDAMPGKTFHGKISMIGAAANSRFALIPQSNPSGQFIKVTQRLPIKVIFSGDTTGLKPGMNVEVEITNKK